MTRTKQVICISWGTKYGAAYVNRLYGMVARHITPPFTFTCFTDTRDGVRPEVQLRELPPLPCEMPRNTPGKWPKSRLWGRELGGLSGPVLFIDLDVVVTGSLDDFFTYGDPDRVILAHNAAKPFHRLGQTSIFRFPVGKLAPLQAILAEDPQGIGQRYRYEQYFVTKNAPGGVDLWPRAWVRHFRIQCVRPFPLNLVTQPRKPRDARVVIFAGDLNPADAVAGRWSPDHPADLSIGEHLAHVRRTGGGFKALRSYVKPTGWVRDAWSE